MPLIPPTSDRFAAVAATLHVSERLVGRWLASRTGCRGTIVSTSEGGRGQFHYTGAAQWWLQLRARSTLTVAGRPVGVRVTGHRTHDHLVVVDIATVDGSPLDAGGAGPAREEQDRLDVELGAYWTSRQLPGDVVGVGPNEGQDGQAATVTVDSAVIDAMPHPVYVTAADGCYVGANAAFAEAAGLPVGELVGRCPGEVWR
ncbi:MAG: PAS domain-containing protein, partial [Actinomycetota bacterium]